MVSFGIAAAVATRVFKSFMMGFHCPCDVILEWRHGMPFTCWGSLDVRRVAQSTNQWHQNTQYPDTHIWTVDCANHIEYTMSSLSLYYDALPLSMFYNNFTLDWTESTDKTNSYCPVWCIVINHVTVTLSWARQVCGRRPARRWRPSRYGR